MYAPDDVLEFIASRVSNSIRELEGALIRVTAFASLTRSSVQLSLAEEVLRDFMPDGAGPEITADQIMVHTADYFGVSLEDLRGHSRSRVLVNARQVAMYLCRELTDLSLPRIGQAFGGRDHTTVMHADRKIPPAHGRAALALQPDRRADEPDQAEHLTPRRAADERQPADKRQDPDRTKPGRAAGPRVGAREGGTRELRLGRSVPVQKQGLISYAPAGGQPQSAPSAVPGRAVPRSPGGPPPG